METVRSLGELLTGRRVDGAIARSLWLSASGSGPDAERLNRAAALLLSRPEAQLT